MLKKYRKPYLIFFFVLLSCQIISKGWADTKTKKVCFKNCCIQVELATTDSEKRKGLMFRENLAENEGMLFVFEKEEFHGFWMKNMNFPLDIIWINNNKVIADIKKNVSPCRDSCETIFPAAKSRYVLEVSSGFADKKMIKIGDRVDF